MNRNIKLGRNASLRVRRTPDYFGGAGGCRWSKSLRLLTARQTPPCAPLKGGLTFAYANFPETELPETDLPDANFPETDLPDVNIMAAILYVVSFNSVQIFNC